MLPVLQIGPLAVQASGLMLLLGLWLGLSLAERTAHLWGVSGSTLYSLAFVMLIAGVAGARLAYLVRFPTAFASDPFSIVSLNPGLLDIWGGLAAALLVGLIYGQRKGLALWPTLDSLTPALAVLSVAIGLSHLASGAAFGRTTELPWGIELWAARRHPSQIYETLVAGLILAAFWPTRKIWREKPSGMYFLSFVASSALARLFLEAFRGDSLILAGGLRVVQIVAWIILAASLWGRYRLQKKNTSPDFTSIAGSVPQKYNN